MAALRFLHLARERWRVLVGCFLACLLVSATVSLLLPKTYSSTSLLYISAQGTTQNAQSAYQGGLLSADRVKSYVEIITSERVGAEVSAQLQLPDSPQAVTRKLSASSQPDTVLISITATDETPTSAVRLVNSASSVFVGIVQEVERPIDANSAPLVVARVIQPGGVNDTPVSPRLSLNILLGVLLGLALGIFAAVLQDFLDSTVKSSEVLSRTSGTPVLGSISYLAGGANRESDRSPDSVSEDVRALRTNLSYISVDTDQKVLVVTSAVAGEGKTSTCIDLALSAAAAGRTVLVVDADLRKPAIAEYLNLEQSVGLVSILTGRVNFEQALQQVKGSIRAHFVSSGAIPPNPSELLGSRQMKTIVDEARSKFDLVLIDSPPLLVTDAAALSELCDGYLLICKHGSTSLEKVRLAAEAIRQAGGNLVGSVLTMIPKSRSVDYGYSYYRADHVKQATVKREETDSTETSVISGPYSNSAAMSRPTPRPRGG